MKSPQLVKELKKQLGEEQFHWTFDEKKDRLRLEHKTIGRGMDISLGEILAKYETKKDAAIAEVVYTIEQTFLAMEREQNEGFAGVASVYPVIRSTSFPQAPTKVPSKYGALFIPSFALLTKFAVNLKLVTNSPLLIYLLLLNLTPLLAYTKSTSSLLLLKFSVENAYNEIYLTPLLLT